jgi:ABC transporter DrrB family efflux protein
MATAYPAYRRPAPTRVLNQIAVLTWRNLLRNVRLPQLLVFATIQPVMFLLLFNYVFGGAIHAGGGQGGTYIDFLLPGLLAQTSLFGATQTTLGLTEDLANGAIDRFRSLPISRITVLAGRTISDLLRNVFVIGLMLVVGFVLGFRLGGSILGAVAALGLILAFAFAFSWVMATVGLAVKNPEAAQAAGFLVIFPLTFASSVFVPTQTMPSWLQRFTLHQPVTVVVNSVRGLTGGTPVGADVLQALAWTAAILAVFVPLAVQLFRRAAQ